MKHYLEQINDVFYSVDSTPEGLSSAEAAKRLSRDGKNKLVEAKKDSILKRFIGQLVDPMILILIVAAGISAVLAVFENEFPSDVVI
jgi:Ca2+-transporting ATPase